MTKVSLADLVAGAIAGKVISFPTDTVPALAVLPERSELIFALKKRPSTKSLILMGASAADLWSYVAGSPSEKKVWQQVTDKYWPGQLTLVLPASACVPSAINPSHSETIGIRVPSHPLAQTILSQTGPLATTSANLSGEAPLETVAEIETAFPSVLTLDVPLDTGSKSGTPSTLAKWTGNDWKILRQGNIKDI